MTHHLGLPCVLALILGLSAVGATFVDLDSEGAASIVVNNITVFYNQDYEVRCDLDTDTRVIKIVRAKYSSVQPGEAENSRCPAFTKYSLLQEQCDGKIKCTIKSLDPSTKPKCLHRPMFLQYVCWAGDQASAGLGSDSATD